MKGVGELNPFDVFQKKISQQPYPECWLIYPKIQLINRSTKKQTLMRSDCSYFEVWSVIKQMTSKKAVLEAQIKILQVKLGFYR